jgi:dipeptidyl aminopeptidase/acylaminoacyl peptidase
MVVACLFAASLSVGCGMQSGTLPSADYAVSRTTFKTKLTREGPAPAPPSAVHYSKLKRPPDVDEVKFTSGTLELRGWLKRPNVKGAKFPAVVFLHGGWGFDESDWDHSQPFRDAGYLVLSPMLRGENGCPGSFTMFYDEVDDVIAAVEFVSKRDDVDPQRVYLAGYSSGATLTIMAALVSDRIRAAAVLDGSPDRRKFVQGRESEVPFDISDSEELRMRSPMDFAAKFKCPIRFYCSTNTEGLVDDTRRVVRSAKSQELDADLVLVPGDHANFRLPATELAVKFFRDH